MDRNPKGRSRLKRAAFTAITVIGVPLLAMLLLEGASSGMLFTPDVIRALRTTGTANPFQQYDSLLGWVSLPNVDMRDLWGPGMHMRTNAQGFRGSHNTDRRPAEGKLRILCSGDSFTMGEGVDDDHTWCALLAAKEARLESVNLGQSGYGVDQAYLRFKREGRPLEHRIHIFAFITDDFRRMGSPRFNYFGKPVLVLKEGVLETENVPVPRSFTQHPKLRYLLDATRELRMARLVQHLKTRFGEGAAETAASDSAAAAVMTAIIGDLSAMSRDDGAALILVHFPVLGEYMGPSPSADRWRERLRAASDRDRSVRYLDLIAELRRLPPDSAVSMFIPYQEDAFQDGGWGHLTRGGNQWAADLLFKQLGGILEIQPHPR
jgi:hypothetical protein